MAGGAGYTGPADQIAGGDHPQDGGQGGSNYYHAPSQATHTKNELN